MGFGPQYVFKQTPKIIQAIQNGLNFFCAGVLYFLPFVARILHTNTDDLSQIMGIAVLFVNTLEIGRAHV